MMKTPSEAFTFITLTGLIIIIIIIDSNNLKIYKYLQMLIVMVKYQFDIYVEESIMKGVTAIHAYLGSVLMRIR